MRVRIPFFVVALGMALLIAGCGMQPAPATVTKLSSSAATLPASGGSDTLSWSGSGVTDYTLTVSPGTGVKINGTAYSGVVDLKTGTAATVTFPANTSTSGVTYTFTLTASGGSGTTPVTKTVNVTVGPVDPSIGSFVASPVSLPAAGGSSSLSWTGSAVIDYSLTVSPSAGVQVNGSAYGGRSISERAPAQPSHFQATRPAAPSATPSPSLPPAAPAPPLPPRPQRLVS